MNQREIPVLGEVRMRFATAHELSACNDELDAIRLCYNLSGRKHEDIARDILMSPASLSRIIRGTRHLPARKRGAFMRACGNYAPIQYEAFSMGFDLVERSKDARIRELEEQLNQLKEAAA